MDCVVMATIGLSEMRVFIGPNEIAGQYRNLALALRSLQVECEYYVFDETAQKYGGDIGDSGLPRYIRKISLARGSAKLIWRKLYSIAIDILTVVFFLRCLFIYDAFIFGFGNSFLRWNLDLPILRLFRKKIIANMSHGSDMTPSYIDGAFLDSDMSMPSVEFHLKRVLETKARVRRFEKYANYIIGSPISSSFFSNKPFISIFSTGRVSQGFRDVRRGRKPEDGTSKDFANKIIILHAPSHAPGKGTAIVRDVIGELVDRGYPIEFREISGCSNDVVLQELQQCDLVLDQVYADLPMSGLAAEAACFGKPTVVSGYDLIALKEAVPTERFPPVFICRPDELLETMSMLLDDPSRIIRVGKEAKEFVFNRWGELSVAKRYYSLLMDEMVPADWWHDPRSIVFLHGYGLSESSSREMILKMIDAYGIKGLCMSHRSDLEAAFLSYAQLK